LTPQDQRRFLDLLIGQRLLAARARREPRAWTADDSAQYGALRDRLVLNAALDSSLRAEADRRRARGEPAPGPDTLGILARDSTVAALAPEWDAPLLAKLAAAFDSLPRPAKGAGVMEQLRLAGALPVIAPADTAAALARTRAGPLLVSDLMAAWRRLNPIYRPRIATAAQVRDLAANVLYERELRRAAAAEGLARRPDIAAQLDEQAEYLDVRHFVAREVYARIPLDSLTLLRHYRARLSAWDLPEHATLFSLTLETRAVAESMLSRLTGPGAAESLQAHGGGVVTPRVTAARDSARLARARAAGAGAVLGPDSLADGWRVARVMAVEPRRHRTFAEARTLVMQDWYGAEGERRMQALLDDLHRRARIERNERALAGLRLPAPAP
ncbi:MAG TPA: peptidyl-prolyl cis-trans isomerase, partial [Candidatus Eisenbacteria bacterium]|nr:peptidyl-prolyl cis-trans isomerase [Candidatus Eisenbacteria bacterium]